MSNELANVFNYEGNNVRTVIKNEEVLFVAKDLCDILELDDISKAVSRLDDDERGTSLILTPGGPQC
jgi:prophage antirepressor-like protein